MTTVAGRSRCVKCEKDRATSKCGGCLQDFCNKDWKYHRNELSKQLDDIGSRHNCLQQTLNEQPVDPPQRNELMQRINQWECDSIKTIQQTAEEARKNVSKHFTEVPTDIKRKLDTLAEQVNQCKEEDDFCETDLQHWKEELAVLGKHLTKLLNIDIQQDARPLIYSIGMNTESAWPKQQMDIEEKNTAHMSSTKLPAKREINILLLGSTGTGKSTLISALGHYFVYNTLKQAMQGAFQALMPFSCSYGDSDTSEKKQIKYREDYEYEQIQDVSDAGTKRPRSFVFAIADLLIRIIDTPGLEDAGGLEQDIRNISEIMKSIARYNSLDGICVLLKSNEERLHPGLRYYLSEIVRHVPGNAVENLMFVFTNARATHYVPGTTRTILQNLFEGYQQVNNVVVQIEQKNTFVIDNEGFRCLALHHRDIKLSDEDIEFCGVSWDRTTGELARFFAHVIDRPIHQVHDTISLYQVQRLIPILTHALFEVARNAERAIQQRHEYEKTTSADSEHFSQHGIQILPLNSSRLVCTSLACLGMMYVNGSLKIEYKSLCCRELCSSADTNIRTCAVMDQKSGICTNCYCSWDEHTIISYDYRRIPSRFDSRPNELRQTNEISHTSRNAEYIINTLHEQSAIEDVYKKLCKYLQIHSILPFNDSSPEYLRYFLHEEQMKHRTGADNDGLIRHLTMLRIKHVNEINLLKKTLENERRSWKRTELIRANDIFPLIATLYGLSVNGEQIRKQVDELQFHAEKIKEQEIYVQLPPKANSTQLVLDVKRHISKS